GPDTGLGPKKSAGFLLHVLKHAESRAGPQGFDVGSLVPEHIQENKAPGCRTCRVQVPTNPHASSPCHAKTIQTKREQTVPKPEKGPTPKEKKSQKKPKKKKLRSQE
ncbi:unnamed protein product, partial [Gulo gulo]